MPRRTNVREATEESVVVELGTDIQRWIADRLIEVFDEVVQQGVPDRFVELLKQLDDDQSQGQSQSQSHEGK
jgi:hypothetical protein